MTLSTAQLGSPREPGGQESLGSSPYPIHAEPRHGLSGVHMALSGDLEPAENLVHSGQQALGLRLGEESELDEGLKPPQKHL